MPMLRRLPEMPAGRCGTSLRVNTVMCGLSMPSVPPDITKAMRCSTSCGDSPSRGASAVHSAATAYSRVKSLTPPLPSVLPRIARMDAGSIAPEPIMLINPETSPGPLVAILMTPTDVVRIIVLTWGSGARRTKQPLNEGVCQGVKAIPIVVLANARIHYPRGEFGEGSSFGTPAAHNRWIPRYGSWLSPGRRRSMCVVCVAPTIVARSHRFDKKSLVDGRPLHLDESTPIGP